MLDSVCTSFEEVSTGILADDPGRLAAIPVKDMSWIFLSSSSLKVDLGESGLYPPANAELLSMMVDSFCSSMTSSTPLCAVTDATPVCLNSC